MIYRKSTKFCNKLIIIWFEKIKSQLEIFHHQQTKNKDKLLYF